MTWYVYILECKDQSLYTGITDNLKRRFKEHKSGKGSKFTAHLKSRDCFIQSHAPAKARP